MKNYPEITQATGAGLKEFRALVPDVQKGFTALTQAAMAPGALDAKTKELIALALAVAARCDACLGFHTQYLVKLGATSQEVAEAVGVAVQMGGGPSLMTAADAMHAFAQAQQAAA